MLRISKQGALQAAAGVIFLEPFSRGVDIRKHLDMVAVADLFAGIDVNEHGFHWSLLSLRRPQ
jgi:hypothetical protein